MPTRTWDNLDPARRDRVMAAAMHEFGGRGFTGGSLNVIAREARIAKGSLFQYFDSKLDLYTHVCDHVARNARNTMVSVIESAWGRQSFWDLLREVLPRWARYFRDHPDERGVLLATLFEADPQVRTAVRAVASTHYVEVLRPMIAEAAAAGDIDPQSDRDHLLALLILLLPHLGLAPWTPGLEPVLGLYGADGTDLDLRLARMIDPLERAFAPPSEVPPPSLRPGPTDSQASG